LSKLYIQHITYQLDILVNNSTTLIIGRLGTFNIPAGQYIYTGSAKKNMEKRIARHLKHDKNLKWHIDYLLNSPQASIVNVRLFPDAECQINQNTTGIILINGFGSSDCHSGCGSHLKYLGPNYSNV